MRKSIELTVRKSVTARLRRAIQEMEKLCSDPHDCLDIMHYTEDLEHLTGYFKFMEQHPGDFSKAKEVNARLIRHPYVRALQGERSDEQVHEMLTDYRDLCLFRMEDIIERMNAPFGQRTKKVIDAKRNYILRLQKEKNTFWSNNR